MKIYVASSWRNKPRQQEVVVALREAGHEVYDFTHPTEENSGFSWSSVDPAWKNWTVDEFRTLGLQHPLADQAFTFDSTAMEASEVCVLVNPCGKSAHLEAGYMAGQGKLVYAIIRDEDEPELMYKLLTGIVKNIEELILVLK